MLWAALVLALAAGAAAGPRLLGSFACKHAAFTAAGQYAWGTPPQLLITSFEGVPFSKGKVYNVAGVGGLLGDVSAIVPAELPGSPVWPNQVSIAPPSALGASAHVVVVPGGFLVPTMEKGAIDLYQSNGNATHWAAPVTVSHPVSDGFYHMVHWRDMDGDGRQDMLTARAHHPLFGGHPGGQLMWLRQPASDPLGGAWDEFPLVDGPDIFFTVQDLDAVNASSWAPGGPGEALVATQFFTEKLVAYYTDGRPWNDTANFKTLVIDPDVGPAFAGQWVDLNGDGRLDLLVTNSIDKPEQSSVFAYEVPTNWRTDPWPRHVLASGFKTREKGIGQASPGAATAYFPGQAHGPKPDIVLSGDGSQEAYIIQPTSTSTASWDYNVTVLLNGHGTIGGISVADVDGDGYKELFVPVYDSGEVFVYTYAGASDA